MTAAGKSCWWCVKGGEGAAKPSGCTIGKIGRDRQGVGAENPRSRDPEEPRSLAR